MLEKLTVLEHYKMYALTGETGTYQRLMEHLFRNFLKTSVPPSRSLSSSLNTILIKTIENFRDDHCGREEKEKRENLSKQKSNIKS